MANQLSAQLLAQLFAQESSDPFLTLVTLDHELFSAPIYLVNNSENITSRGNVYLSFPMRLRLPIDDGETAKSFEIEFDNVALELIDEIRTVTTEISVTIEMILASMPNDVQISQGELKIQAVSYNARSIVATIIMDNFLNTELTSERYNPSNFPGLF
jgi:hypothetical protein